MGKIDIVYGSSGGDCTCPYYITLREPMTVGEFIDEWMSEHPNEWGYFEINNGTYCEYKRGKIEGRPLPKKYLDMSINHVGGSGGWTRSDFIFTGVTI